MATSKFKNIIIALSTVIALGVVDSAYAADNYSYSEVRFIGNSDNLPVFQLELNNKENSQYIITIRNGERKILLSEKLNGTKILRRYKLNTEEPDRIEGTTFEVINKKTKETTVYTIRGNRIEAENKSDFQNLMKLLKAD